MNAKQPAKEGFVDFRGYKVWYRIVGDREVPGKLPLLCWPHPVRTAFDPLSMKLYRLGRGELNVVGLLLLSNFVGEEAVW